MSRRWRPAPTRREKDKWDRANKAATGGSVCYLQKLHFLIKILPHFFPSLSPSMNFILDFHETINLFMLVLLPFSYPNLNVLLYDGTFIIPVLQDAMLREIRRPKGDPEVLAAQSREQYFKVCGTTFM